MVEKKEGKVNIKLVICLMIASFMLFTLLPSEADAATKFSTKTKVKSVKVVSKNYNSVKIKWEKISGAKGYQIYRATSKNGKYRKIATTKRNYIINSKLTTGKYYYYKVRAYKKVKGKTRYTKFSSKLKTYPKLNTTTAKTQLVNNQIKVSWSKVSGVQGYQVYRATSKNGKYSKIATVKGTAVTNTSAAEGKTYYYKVRTYRKVGGKYRYSSYSSIKSAKRAIIVGTPSLTVKGSGQNVTLTIGTVSGATGYEIYRNNTKITSTAGGSYTDKSLAYGTYTYKVRAYKSGVYGSFSAARSVTLLDPANSGIKEQKDCYLDYEGVRIHIGQQWTDSINSALNSGKGAVSYTAQRRLRNYDPYFPYGPTFGYAEYSYFYCYDTIDYDNFLMVFVNGGKIGGWITTRDEVGYYKGELIRTGIPESTYEGKYWEYTDDEGVRLFGYAETEIAETEERNPYDNGDNIIGGIIDNPAYQCTQTNIEQEEVVTEHFVNAVRVARGTYPLIHSDEIYDSSETYGTKAYAKTMAMSDKCSHATQNMTEGPLAGYTIGERCNLIEEENNYDICILGENAAEGTNISGELLFWRWYTSAGHRTPMMEDETSFTPAICNSVSLISVAGYTNGQSDYWALHTGCTLK